MRPFTVLFQAIKLGFTNTFAAILYCHFHCSESLRKMNSILIVEVFLVMHFLPAPVHISLLQHINKAKFDKFHFCIFLTHCYRLHMFYI